MSDLLAPLLVQGRSLVFVQLTVLSALLVIATLIWGQLDQRTLDGVPVWVKPAKFSISFLVHFATLAIIVSLMSPENAELRIVAGMGWVLAAVFVAEMTYLIFQAAQAQHSHFNDTTSFHSAMYSLMGVGAVVLIALPIVIAWLAKRDIAFGPATQSGIWWGAIISFVLTVIIGGYLGGNGSHFVGDQSNPELVLPIFGWSTEVGDLRPAHFLSLHALQVLPLIGIWADRTDQGIITIWIAGFIYSALTVALFIQAIFGQPFIRI
ncbi:hypothetical protein N9X05_14105 [Paracoccaceae bacterium]|nr:hypothetical protein [Paracoccaceae bacterium]